MALQNSFPSGGGLTTHAQARRDLEGSVARSAAGVMRAGVLPNHHNQLYTRRNDMRFDIADFRAVQNKAGAGFIANVGVETTPVFAAAPAANKRIDLLYLSQEITPGDPLNEIKFFIEQGTASPSPVAPSLQAARADAIPWMTVEIPAGATSMQSAGVIVKEIFPYTAMAGGTVIVRDLIELGAWAPADGSRAFCIADNAEYVRSGGAWRRPIQSASRVLVKAAAPANASQQLDVTFPTPYAAAPVVTASPAVDAADGLPFVGIGNVTATGFRVFMAHNFASRDLRFNWESVGL